MYVVGSPGYQNWQHVYTAVTRGVRQVLIINNPGSLIKSIKSLPVTRQTKLQEDMLQAMRYRCSAQEHDQALKTNTQSTTEFRDVHKDEFTLQPFDVRKTNSAYFASEVTYMHTYMQQGFLKRCRREIVFTGRQEVLNRTLL